ncbi:hypothetical protein [Paraburkholderia phytofirmans]|uniref:DNA damage-inducible protein D n=1 Tax=Paraburkholderia phytofirmans OLGA172 TaxID=1417228 RepID=A0A160FPU2_9BURK|nr:hypothetical protein [Paraburkholderia phytofirmans]ANB74476.1 hypothetical protein AYM40_20425 [Paraburkholderia phytofirmans OLGA172]
MLNSKPITALHHHTFESIKQVTEDGAEFWFARDLAPLLDYPQWRNFVPVLERAREACRQSEQQVEYHFADIRKMVEIGSRAQTQTEEKLRREAVKGKQHANQTHFEVGSKVRQTIQELGGTMPENLPTPETSIKQVEQAQKKLKK